MSDTLKQIIEFVAVPLGAVAQLPHHLIINNHPVKPDHVDLPGEFEFVVADTVNISVRNVSSATGDCLVLVEAWHPIERSFGLNPDDGTFSQHLNPQPFVTGGGSAAISSGASPVIVLRPGGVAAQNVVTTWADAMTKLALLQGFRVLEFDDSIISPIVVPAGAYDMTNVIWSGSAGIDAPQVQVVEGVTFTRLRQLTERVQVTFTGTTPPVSDFDVSGTVSDTFTLDHSARVVTAGAGPFFRVTSAVITAPTISLANGATIDAGTTPAINLAVLGSGIVVAIATGSVLDSNTVSGVVGSNLTLSILSAGTILASEDQPGFSGTITPSNITKTRFFPFPSASTLVSTNTVLTDTSVLVLVDLSVGVDFTITLPPAANHRGETIMFKTNDSAETTVTVAPTAGDTTPDGPITLSTPFQAVQVTSDGESIWYQTAEFTA
jgi:hypothetical protein